MEGRTDDLGAYSEGGWDCLTNLTLNLTFPSGTSAAVCVTTSLSIRSAYSGQEGSVGEVGLVPGTEQLGSFVSPPLP